MPNTPLAASVMAQFYGGRTAHPQILDTSRAVVELLPPAKPIEFVVPDPQSFSSAISTDGALLAAICLKRGKARIWKTETGEKIGERNFRSKKPLQAACFSPDLSTLVISAFNGVVSCVSEDGTYVVENCTATDASVMSLAISPHNDVIAVGYADGLIRVFGLAADGAHSQFKDHEGPVTHLSFSSSGEKIASASSNVVVVRDL